MHPWTGTHRPRDRGLVAITLLLAACASSGDGRPPAALPQPLASQAEPVHQPVRPPKPANATRVPVPTRIPVAPPSSPSLIPVKSAPTRPARLAPAVRPRAPRPAPVDSALMERAITKRYAYEPLSLALGKRTRKTELADRVAAAVVYEAERNRISPSLLAAVLLIENAPFDTTAISSQGAVGLMQVMPVHRGSYGCPSDDLHTVEANICHGARLLKTYIRRAKSIHVALTRYNGCVRGRNTPRCHRYPGRVLRTASRLRQDMLVYAAGLGAETPEELTTGQAAQPVTVPSQPMTEPDTSVLTTTTSASECTTFIGCLKHRWSQR